VSSSNPLSSSNIAHRIERDKHPISRKFISEHALKVMRHLNNSGFESYLVGGAVRDLLLNKRPKDFDVATNATPEEIRKLFKNARIIGRRFRIVHVLFGREVIEVTTFRGHHPQDEEQPNNKHTSLTNDQGMLLRDNVFGSVEEDALRRDFSVNALYYSSKDFCVYDYTNGIEDLKKQELRLIGDPAQRFKEDPVRILRALRFAAKLQFTIEPSTYEQIDGHAELLSLIPAARLYDEFSKLFLSGFAFASYTQLKQHEMLKYLISSHEIFSTIGTYEKLIIQGLLNTDDRIQQNKSINPAFLFSVLLWPSFLQAQQQFLQEQVPIFAAMQLAASRVLDEQSRLTSLPKHIQSTIKEIWELQERLSHRHGRRAFKTFEHPKFRAGYDFLLLREQVGEIPPSLGQWWTDFQTQTENEREEAVRQLGASPLNRNKKPRKRKAKPA